LKGLFNLKVDFVLNKYLVELYVKKRSFEKQRINILKTL